MDLEPVRVIPFDVFGQIPSVIGSGYESLLNEKGFRFSSMIDISNYIRDAAMRHPNVQHIAMCSTRMFKMYITEKMVTDHVNFSATMDIYRFLADDNNQVHALHKQQTGKLCDALCAYVSMLPTNNTDSPLVSMLSVHTVGSRQARTSARRKTVIDVAQAFYKKTAPEHEIYHKWIKEYGGD
jgi:hypothetical protein